MGLDLMTEHNGYTNKEMLQLLLSEVRDVNDRIDQLHEKVNSKISRSELLAWTTVVAVLIAGLSNYS